MSASAISGHGFIARMVLIVFARLDLPYGIP